MNIIAYRLDEKLKILRWGMRVKVSISKMQTIAIIVFLIGVCLFAFGQYKQFKINNSFNLESFHSSEVIEGAYFKGDVSSYLLNEQMSFGENTITGVNNDVISLGGVYSIYNIISNDGKYFIVSVSDSLAPERLYLEDSLKEGVYIEGVVEESGFELDYGWYKSALGVNTEEELNDILETKLILKETDFDNNRHFITAGLGAVLLGIVTFFYGKPAKS